MIMIMMIVIKINDDHDDDHDAHDFHDVHDFYHDDSPELQLVSDYDDDYYDVYDYDDSHQLQLVLDYDDDELVYLYNYTFTISCIFMLLTYSSHKKSL